MLEAMHSARLCAFGTSTPVVLRTPCNQVPLNRRRRATPLAGLRPFRNFNIPSPGDESGAGFSIGNSGGSQRFEPFDGSRPLLPPFRPATPEADFSRHGERVRKREQAAREAKEARKVIAVRAGDDLLYAEMVQEGIKNGNVWLRPLMLRRSVGGLSSDGEGRGETVASGNDAQWMDLRQTSDLLLPKDCLHMEPLEPAMRTVLDMTLAASETDLYKRVVDSSADIDSETTKAALSSFVQSLFRKDQDEDAK